MPKLLLTIDLYSYDELLFVMLFTAITVGYV